MDVDEVLGLFVEGFGRFLADRGFELRLDRYALFQNIFRAGGTEHLDLETGRALYNDFFRYGCAEIDPAPGAAEALGALSGQASIVILTNAPGQARLGRARWLGRHRLDYPLILGTGPKGPLAAALAAGVEAPCAFVDDLVPHLDSVAEAAPRIARFQMVADPRLRPLAPSAPERHARVDDWAELSSRLAAIIA